MKNYEDMGLIEMAKTLGEMGDQMKTETCPTHTPTPWKITAISTTPRTYAIYDGEMQKVIVGGLKNEPNAAFIVRACNNHYALVKALKLMIANPAENNPWAIEALAEAENG